MAKACLVAHFSSLKGSFTRRKHPYANLKLSIPIYPCPYDTPDIILRQSLPNLPKLTPTVIAQGSLKGDQRKLFK